MFLHTDLISALKSFNYAIYCHILIICCEKHYIDIYIYIYYEVLHDFTYYIIIILKPVVKWFTMPAYNS